MYRQSHSSFGRASYRVNSVPENYSGNAFRKNGSDDPEQKEIPKTAESVSRDPTEENISLPVKKESLSAERENSEGKGALNGLTSLAKLNIASDTALLFLVLLILSAGGGEQDDGAIFMILILLML